MSVHFNEIGNFCSFSLPIINRKKQQQQQQVTAAVVEKKKRENKEEEEKETANIFFNYRFKFPAFYYDCDDLF